MLKSLKLFQEPFKIYAAADLNVASLNFLMLLVKMFQV